MDGASKELKRFISHELHHGKALEEIEQDLERRGYPERVAKGIVLGYKHRATLFAIALLAALTGLFATGLYLTGTGVVGLAAADAVTSHNDLAEFTIDHDSERVWLPSRQGDLAGLRLSGSILGQGSARAFLVHGEDRRLILDTSQQGARFSTVEGASEDIRIFEGVCQATCRMDPVQGSTYLLAFETDGAILEVDRIGYDLTAERGDEEPATFIAIPDTTITLNSSLLIDLDSYFTVEGATFSMLADPASLETGVQGTRATLRPLRPGIIRFYVVGIIDETQAISNQVTLTVLDQGPSADVELRGSLVSGMGEGRNPIILVLLGITLAVLVVVLFLGYQLSEMLAIRRLAQSRPSLAKASKDASARLRRYFDDTAARFEKTTDHKHRERLYRELRKQYLLLMKSALPDKDKQQLYKRINTFYKLLNGQKQGA